MKKGRRNKRVVTVKRRSYGVSDGLVLGAVSQREIVKDALVNETLKRLRFIKSAVVGTTLRRIMQLKMLRPDIEIKGTSWQYQH